MAKDRSAYFAAYALAHREHNRVRSVAYRLANLEKVTAAKQSWVERNPDYWKQRYAENKDRMKVAHHEWYLRHAAERIEYVRQYRRANHDKLMPMWRHVRNAYRARKEGAVGSHTEQEWADTVVLHGGCCLYCGQQGKMVRDHKVPLSRGGSDDITNIAPACTPCNSSKGAKTTTEFLAVRGGSRG